MYTGTGGGTVQISSNGTPLIGSGGATFSFSPGPLQWIGGTIGGTGTLTNAGTMTISGSNGNSLETSLDNQGTITDSETGGVFFSSSATTLTIASNAFYNIVNSGGWNGGTITNDGTIEKTAGSGAFSDSGSTFQNDGGTINVQSGSFLFFPPAHQNSGPGTSTGGTFDVSAGATLGISGIGTLTGAYTGTGGGKVLIDGNGELAIGAAGASFDLAAGMLQWVAGDITGPGTLTNAGDMQVLDDNGGQTFKSVVGGLTLLNTGTMTWNFTGSLDGGYFSTDSISQVVNQGTVQWLNGLLAGNFSDGTNGTFSLSGSDSKTIGGNSTFTNLGVIDQNGSGSLCLGAGGSIGITTGNVNNQKGATYNLETAGTVQMGDGTFNNSGTFVVLRHWHRQYFGDRV